MARDDSYSSLEITADSVKFSKSRFGKHRLAMLQRLKADALDNAMNLQLSDSVRAHQATVAATFQKVIDVFVVAEKISDDPKLKKRLHDAASERSKKQKDV